MANTVNEKGFSDYKNFDREVAKLKSSSNLLIQELQKSKGKFKDDEVRPSSISQCARRQVYQAINFPGNEFAMKELEGIAFLGNVIDERLADIYSKQYEGKTYRQFPLKTPYGVTAHPDIWVPNQLLDVEVKSVSVASKYYGLPREEHVDQLMLRLHFHHKYRGKKAKGELIYFFRETFLDPATWEPLSFPVEYDKQKGELLEERLKFILRCVKEKTLPGRESENPYAYPCKTKTKYLSVECPYREECWEEELAKDSGVSREDAAELLKRYKELNDMKRTFTKNADAVKGEIEDIQAALDEIFEREDTERINAGGLSVKRSYTKPRQVSYEAKGYYRYYLSQKKEEKEKGVAF